MPGRGKGVAGQGSSLDKVRGSVSAGWGRGERERVGGNEAGFIQRALNATIKDPNLIL